MSTCLDALLADSQPKPEPTPEQRAAWATYLQARYDRDAAFAAQDDMACWAVLHPEAIGGRQ